MRDTAEYRAEEKNDFTVGDMRGSILRIAVPMIMAQLVNVLYNIVDRVYLGHMEGDGRLALTGVGVAFPLITIINAFANLCGSGGAPLCSIERGRGNLKKAEETMGNSLVLLLLLGVVLTAAGYLFKTPALSVWRKRSDDCLRGRLSADLPGWKYFCHAGTWHEPFYPVPGIREDGNADSGHRSSSEPDSVPGLYLWLRLGRGRGGSCDDLFPDGIGSLGAGISVREKSNFKAQAVCAPAPD